MKKTKRIKNANDMGEEREYSPAAQTLSVVQMSTGLFMRALSIALLTFGGLLYVDDALSLGCGAFLLLLYSVISVAAFSLMMTGEKKALIGVGIAVAAVGAVLLIHPNIIEFYRESVKYTFDAAMKLLVERGFDNYSAYITGASGMGLRAVSLYRGALGLLAALLGCLYSVCLMRRTVISPVLVSTLCLLVPGLTFNLSSSNIGLAIIVASLMGAAAMKLFDARFRADGGERVTVYALGGYVAGTVILLAMLSAIVPVLVVKDRWDDIPVISQPIDAARDVVDSVISGDAPDLLGVGIIKNMDGSNSRDVSVKTREYTGDTVMTVRSSYGSTSYLYLRGWVADVFDGSSWLSVTSDRLALYKAKTSDAAEKAGYDLSGEVYSADSMTDALYELLPSVYRSNENDADGKLATMSGFYGAYVDIRLKSGAGTGNLLFVPAVRSTDAGLMKYDNTSKGYTRKCLSYFDGMYITGWLNIFKKYTALAYVPQMSEEDFGDGMYAKLGYYRAMRTLLEAHASGEYSDAELIALQGSVLSALDVSLEDGEKTYFERYLDMDSTAKAQAYARYVTLVDAYTEYAEQNYGEAAGCDIPAIITAAEKILAGVGEDATVHAKTLAAVQYVIDEFSYSKTPKLPSLSGYDGFLRETQEGDHVQLATTLTLILRRMGITARYAEGYIATDFKQDTEGDGAVCEVTDKNAHAWVEVYYEGLGWIPYETVKKYAKKYYGNNITASSGASGNIGGGVTVGGDGYLGGDVIDGLVPELPTVDVTENDGGAGAEVLGVFFLLVAVCVGAAVMRKKLRERSERAVGLRKKLIDAAKSGDLDGEALNDTAGAISSEVLGMLSVAGYAARKGELPTEYAARVEADCPYGREASFTEIMALIQKQEFGNGVTAEELSKVGGYLDGLWSEVYASENGAKRFWHRYVQNKL